MIDESRKLTVLLGTAGGNHNDLVVGKAVTAENLQAARRDLPAEKENLLQHVTIVIDDMKLYTDTMELANWRAHLSEGATVSIVVTKSEQSVDPILTSFLLAGLKNVSERRDEAGRVILTANKPQSTTVKTNGALPLKLKKVNAVKISLHDGVEEDDDDLIDEDGLLSGMEAPPAMQATSTKNDDCGGRTACDNCTCGRAEQEAGAATKKSTQKSSNCGKCGMGDAFRCASCPYLGMPAFKPGQEPVILDLQDDF